MGKRHRLRCQHAEPQKAALATFLMRLPVDVLEEQDLVGAVMSRHEGRRLDYQLSLQVRDEVRATIKKRDEYEAGE